jgi:hypothetical protein
LRKTGYAARAKRVSPGRKPTSSTPLKSKLCPKNRARYTQ